MTLQDLASGLAAPRSSAVDGLDALLSAVAPLLIDLTGMDVRFCLAVGATLLRPRSPRPGRPSAPSRPRAPSPLIHGNTSL
jgi:hypothetical protein